jgi:hypothetical protein
MLALGAKAATMTRTQAVQGCVAYAQRNSNTAAAGPAPASSGPAHWSRNHRLRAAQHESASESGWRLVADHRPCRLDRIKAAQQQVRDPSHLISSTTGPWEAVMTAISRINPLILPKTGKAQIV